MSQQKYLFVISKGPYSSAKSQEALDAIIVACSFEFEVSVLLIQDGLFQIKLNQSTKNTKQKQVTKTYLALEELGVSAFYCDESSMLARGIELVELMLPAQSLDHLSIREIIAQQDRVFTF